MITGLTVRGFKSLEDVDVELGQVNVFIGANGSGKTNLLEALGVLGAAAAGRVNDEALLYRGVRPGVPQLYKTSFPPRRGSAGQPRHLFVGAGSETAAYEVALWNPLNDPLPAWKYKTEVWREGHDKLVGRSPASRPRPNPELGLAALEAVNHDPSRPAVVLLDALQKYVIYTPSTSVLRGTAPETQTRRPLGLSGGQLPVAVSDLLGRRAHDDHAQLVCRQALVLLDWASMFGAAPADALPLSAAAAASPTVIRFRDRFMAPSRNILSGYDASEGALYVLFLAALAAHEASPPMFAVDNADHGLNPRLARALIGGFCEWMTAAPRTRQALLTTHNPLVLDGLPLQDDRVRLFTVSRTVDGRTTVDRVVVDEKLHERAKEGWTLSRLWVMGHLGGVPDV